MKKTIVINNFTGYKIESRDFEFYTEKTDMFFSKFGPDFLLIFSKSELCSAGPLHPKPTTYQHLVV